MENKLLVTAPTNRIINIIVALVLAASLSLTSISPGSAQDPEGYIAQAPTMDPEEVGRLHPVGLAFSAQSQNFYVIEAQSPSQALAATSEVVAVTPLADREGPAKIAATIQDPLNIVFDNQNNRLLAFQPATGQLIEVPENPGGNLDRAMAIPHNIGRSDIREPRGLALDERSGSLFILDATGPRIVRIQSGPNRSFSGGRISIIDLSASGLVSPRGIAFDPTTGHLHVFDLIDQTLYELTQSGRVITTRNLAPFGLKSPQAMVFAPSGDQTDDPAQMSLFVADSGLITGRGTDAGTESSVQSQDELSSSIQSTGQIVELSMVEPVAAAASNYNSTLIKMTDLSTISPPGPDSSGLAYIPVGNRLMVSDGEVEETAYKKTHFQGANVWELTLGGSVIRTANISPVAPTVVPMSDEPTGVAWNPNNGHYYFSDDTGSTDVYDLNPGLDGLVGTSDDTWTGFSTSSYGGGDAEGIAYDTWFNRLFVVDGANAEVYEYTLTGTLINQFDVLGYGVPDPEAVEFNPDTGTLFVMSSNNSNPVMIETTRTGALLQTINIASANAIVPAGLAYAPASDGSGERRFYIVDRGYDNNEMGNLIDGKLFEMSAPPSGPTPTPSQTFTPSNTPLPGSFPTSTLTSTPASTPTSPPSGNSFFASFASSGTVGGLSFADEDILRFDGQNWSTFFDGSDVGAGSPDLLGFSIVDADTILMSFGSNVTLNGLAITPRDIVQFDATSLGATTVGTFSMYFNGANVGLSASGEKIDAMSVLSDGRILISTTGDISVPGASGRDEDITAFTPASLGSNTSGTWSLYFDGSDVGLSNSTSEDINAAHVFGSDLYLSTASNFSVSGVSGAGEDVFICSPISLGDVTACNFSSSLFFDGSEWGMSGNTLDGLQIGTAGPLPSPTPTASPGNTSTPTATPTSTPTSLFSPTPTATPTNTPTGLPSSTPTHTSTSTPTATSTSTSVVGESTTSTFTPDADAYVRSPDPTANYGTAPTLRAYRGGSSQTNSHLRFSVAGITGPVQSAKLRLYVTDASSVGGGTLYQTVDNNWTETGINYSNQPVTTGSALTTVGPVNAGVWIEIDVSSVVTANGVYTFAILGNSSDVVYYASRETVSKPELLVIYSNSSSSLAALEPSPSDAPMSISTPTPTLASTDTPEPIPTLTATPLSVSTDAATPTEWVVPTDTATVP